MRRKEIDPDVYPETLMKKCEEVEYGLKYYINQARELELENKLLREMYENRVNEFLKFKKQISDRLEYYLIGNSKYKNTQVEFKKLLKLVNEFYFEDDTNSKKI